MVRRDRGGQPAQGLAARADPGPGTPCLTVMFRGILVGLLVRLVRALDKAADAQICCAPLYRTTIYWARVAVALIVVSVTCALAGCGQSVRLTASHTNALKQAKASVLPAKLVARVAARNAVVDKTAARLKVEAARLVRQQKDAGPDARRHVGLTLSRLKHLSALVKKPVVFRSPSQVSTCVDRARTRLLKSLAGRVPSAVQVKALLNRCFHPATKRHIGAG